MNEISILGYDQVCQTLDKEKNMKILVVGAGALGDPVLSFGLRAAAPTARMPMTTPKATT